METKKCTKCFSEIHLKATVCPNCKSTQTIQLTEQEKKNLTKVLKWLVLIIIFPIGIIYGLYQMWNKKLWGPKRRWAITIVAGLFLLGIASSNQSSNSNTSHTADSSKTVSAKHGTTTISAPVATAGPTDTPEPTPTPVPKDSNGFPMDAETVTVAALDKAPSNYDGKKVIFTCTVASFAKDDSGNAAAVNCSDPNDFSSLVQVGTTGFDMTQINQLDRIKVYGLGMGSAKGKNAFGGEVSETLVMGLYINDLTSGYKE